MSEKKIPNVTVEFDLEEISLLKSFLDNPQVAVPIKGATIAGRIYDKVTTAREKIVTPID